MIGKIFGIMTAAAFICAFVNGNMNELAGAAACSASKAVELVFSLAGSMCLWSGFSRVMDKCGFTEKLRKVILPLLKIIYPDAYKKNNGIKECAANIGANFLGLGNAALPLGIETVKKFSENGGNDKKRASDDAVMFAVLATTPFQLLPITLTAMREGAGSAAPYEIILPVWICEAATTVFAVIICKIMAKIFK